jgi:hypothetical protein
VSYGSSNTIVTEEAYKAARERLKRLFADRQAAKKIIDRIAAGEPRQSFGRFQLSFEDIEAFDRIDRARTRRAYRGADNAGGE